VFQTVYFLIVFESIHFYIEYTFLDIDNSNSIMVFLIFPHQLFESVKSFNTNDKIYLIEYFDYSCKIKKILHYASMLYYRDYLIEKGFESKYIKSDQVEQLINVLILKKIPVRMFDPVDNEIYKLMKKINVLYIETPYFLTSVKNLKEYNEAHPSANQETFYRWQRRRLNILMNGDVPVGGKYNFDKLNRTNPRIEVDVKLPLIGKLSEKYYKLTKKENLDLSENYGDEIYGLYPCTHIDSKKWFLNFLKEKLSKFAQFQDVHYVENPYLYHSVITPMLNIGLLTPKYVVKQSLNYAKKNNVGVIPLEAFIRQIIGWREYMRYMYLYGKLSLKMNFFNNTNTLYKSYYTGDTGIVAIDDIIKSVNKTGYAHHIVRLMWLGSFFMLTQTKPSLVYKWFMELFVDAYDWVMIPNVIGMSQYADGGIVSSRPYFSSANYLKKMSNFIDVEDVNKWNSLYYKFLNDKPQLMKLYIVSNWVKFWRAKSTKEKNDIIKIANLTISQF